MVLRPQSDTTVRMVIFCGEEIPGTGPGMTEEKENDGRPDRPSPLGVQLLQATLLTNVVYPIDAFGEPIRHFCPGKNWNSLYTWDCGFIGWAMAGKKLIRYLSDVKYSFNSYTMNRPSIEIGRRSPRRSSPSATSGSAAAATWSNSVKSIPASSASTTT